MERCVARESVQTCADTGCTVLVEKCDCLRKVGGGSDLVADIVHALLCDNSVVVILIELLQSLGESVSRKLSEKPRSRLTDLVKHLI